MATDIPSLSWKENGTPVSTRFDDPYYSIHDGLAETRHVFLDGNALATRLRPGFRVAELGFGTGLNLLAVAVLAAELAVEVHFTSFEAYPLATDEMRRALSVWPELRPVAETFLDAYHPKTGRYAVGAVTLDLIVGRAEATLPEWTGQADAWFLDGFSPARNPDLWSEELMREVGRHTARGGTFATYTSAGHVRRSLTSAGFDVHKQPGFGRKREMSTGTLAET